MTNVPPEYLGYDYGFTAVDESDMLLKKSQAAEPAAPQLPADVLESILDRIESKLDNIGIAVQDVGAKGTALVESTEYGEKIKKLEAIIVPLLNNLLKTADKEWIHWPNRRETLQRQLDAVISITRG